MVDALAARLPAGAVRLNTAVERVERSRRRRLDRPRARPTAARSFAAVIVATPSHVAASCWRRSTPSWPRSWARSSTRARRSFRSATIATQVAHPLNGMGVVVPAIESSPILAVSFSSQKYTHRAPEGKTLLRVFAGGARRPELAEMDDDKLRPAGPRRTAPTAGHLAASRVTAASPTGRGRCRSTTWATRTSSRGSTPASSNSPAWPWPATLSRRRHSRTASTAAKRPPMRVLGGDKP